MRDIVFLGVNDWRAIKQRPQHLAQRLAATGRYRVLYVNPVNYSALTHVYRSARRTTGRGWRPRLEALAAGLWVFTPSPALPFSRRVRPLNRGNQALLAAQLQPVLARLGLARPLLWASFPTAVDLVGRLGESGVVFDCLDLYAGFFHGGEARQVAAMEQALLGCAGLVLAPAEPLVAACRRANANVHLVPNGVEAAHFARARLGLPPPADLAALARPRFVYVGTIGRWTDVEALLALAQAATGGSVVVIGPWEVPVPPAPVNFQALGPRPYADLPAYLAGCDVALIPFRPGPLTAVVNPVKLFEYAAAGLPIVATATPELRRYAGWCDLATTPAEFVNLALAAAADAGVTTARERRDRAAQEAAAADWDARVAQIEPLLEELDDRAPA